MGFETTYITPDIKLSVYTGPGYTTEVIFEHHMLVWFMSGETRIVRSEGSYVFGPGDIFLIPRHQIATIISTVRDGHPHRSVVMHLTPARLRAFYADQRPVRAPWAAQEILRFGKHPLLESCLSSLMPYFDLSDAFPESIATLKITEAIQVLRTIDPSIDGILANFEEPGKIDLAAFMEKNFIFNLPLGRFATLTGRSLSTFSRDFKRIFHTTPQKWLTQKRLEYAHYQISEQKKKPVDVYLEVGFVDLSHFSFAFKKRFGYSPAEVPS
ncbi:MAG TPA: helix-turn-helix domain-containing protein [Dinghuibacter sp.]|jgi:AraC-like DNA-binding protein|uniref:helix-turn-helix domain-containing protein n=1 Tax=Dinghuibacter sp. TaxID=2024697 RepID=UPI002BF89007|nr:helix-turn-helix domain-containing protein [Dinghuibacter sp.]HTJ13343.1 helix-turn-helix domain-containing protein [Dinghuibacter sp.]